jgi:hypothetical protein
MTAYAQGEQDSLSKDDNELLELQHEESTIEAQDHDGFADAARLTRVKSEIEELQTDIFHKKVQIEDESS